MLVQETNRCTTISDVFGDLKIGAPQSELAHSRADLSSYDSYYRGMDTTARQKVALTTPHIAPSDALIADMGMGTGATTFDLANLYPRNRLVGIDIDPHSVASAAARYGRRNLSFVQGDLETLAVPSHSIDAALFSSILHELPCYCPEQERFKFSIIGRVLDSTVEELKTGGYIIVRDFVAPHGPEVVFLDLPLTDGAAHGTPPELCGAALFEEFARTFKSSRYPKGGLDKIVEKVGEIEPGWVRYKVPLRDAAEFVLRRFYTDRWEEELREEYIYWSQTDAVTELSKRNLRIIAAHEIHNPWIIQNYFEGHFRLSGPNGEHVEFPPTNFLIVGEKVGPNEGVVLEEEKSHEIKTPSYIRRAAYKNIDPHSSLYGKVLELVERPNETVDLVPWFKSEDGIYVLAKSDYPRPITGSTTKSKQIDRATSSGYIAEPINGLLTKDSGQVELFDAELGKLLHERAAATRKEGSAATTYRYFTSPGGLDELVTAVLVPIEPQENLRLPHANYSGFAGSGIVRPLEARQALRAYQVGGMFDSRLEINLYRLLMQEKISFGPWIGANVTLTEQPADNVPCASLEKILAVKTQSYQSVPVDDSQKFLELRSASFVEKNAKGDVIARRELEYAQPRSLSNNTGLVFPVVKTAHGILVGIEERDLPAPQAKLGNARVISVPAFRMPLDVTNPDATEEYLRKRMELDFGVTLKRLSQLGGKYFPSAGILPETVLPFIAEVDVLHSKQDSAPEALRWVPLQDLLARQHELTDAHLLTSLFRAAHALGLEGLKS